MNGIQQMLRSVQLIGGTIDPLTAELTVSLTIKNTRGYHHSAFVRVELFELGYDGSKPDSPLAVEASNYYHIPLGDSDFKLDLRVGTPFFWTTEARPCYSLMVSIEPDGGLEQYSEIQFGFDSSGSIVVTREMECVALVAAEQNITLPSLFVMGDSTAFSNGRNQQGWGDVLEKYLDPAVVKVHNRARPGRSTRSYLREGLWARVLAEMKVGDYLLIQFGHNDADHLDGGRYRGVLPGIGEETFDVTMPDGTQEIVHTFGWYLRRFVTECQMRRVIPVILSLTAKNIWRNERLIRHQSEYGTWSAAVAAACDVSFIDLTQAIADRYDALGIEKVQALFCNETDNVHTSPSGAKLNAECVAAGLSQFKFFPTLGDLKSNVLETRLL